MLQLRSVDFPSIHHNGISCQDIRPTLELHINDVQYLQRVSPAKALMPCASLCRQSSPLESHRERLQSHNISSADLCAPASAAAAAASLPIASLDAGIFSMPLPLTVVSRPMPRRPLPLGSTHMQPLTSAFSAIAASWPAAMPYLPGPNTLASVSLPFSFGAASLAPLSAVVTAVAAQSLENRGESAKLSMQTAAQHPQGQQIEIGAGDRPSSGESAAADNNC